MQLETVNFALVVVAKKSRHLLPTRLMTPKKPKPKTKTKTKTKPKTKTNTKTKTITKTNKFKEHIQRATLETCDL